MGGLRTPCGATNPARATWPRKARTGLPVRLPPHGGLGTTRGRGTAPETRKVRSPKGTGIAWRGRKLERGRSRTQALSPRGEAPGRGRNRGSGRARGPRPIRGGVSRPHGDSHGRPEAVNRGPVPAIRGQPRRAPAKQGQPLIPGVRLRPGILRPCGATLTPPAHRRGVLGFGESHPPPRMPLHGPLRGLEGGGRGGGVEGTRPTPPPALSSLSAGHFGGKSGDFAVLDEVFAACGA